MTTSAPPGWYPDPSGGPSLRWFDGSGWTPYLAPSVTPPTATTPGLAAVPGAVSLAPAPVDPMLYWLLPIGRTWQQVAAPWFGLLAFFLVPLGFAGIAIGVWALIRTPHTGRGRPIVGIVLSTLAVSFWGAVLIGNL